MASEERTSSSEGPMEHRPLASLYLSSDIRKILSEAGILTVMDLINKTESDLLGILNVNQIADLPTEKELIKSELDARLEAIAEVRDALRGFDLSLRDSHDAHPNRFLSIEHLRLSIGLENGLKGAGILTVGQLTDLTTTKLLKLPRIGKGGLRQVQHRLQEFGLTLAGSVGRFKNEPKLEAARLPLSPPPRFKTYEQVSYLEDELQILLEQFLMEQDRDILKRRCGWQASPAWTLEAIAVEPSISGPRNPVSRERIRQLETRGRKKLISGISNLGGPPPRLIRAVNILVENSPCEIKHAMEVLAKEQLSREPFLLSSLKNWAEACGVEWPLIDLKLGHQESSCLIFCSDEKLARDFLSSTKKALRVAKFARVRDCMPRSLTFNPQAELLCKFLIGAESSYRWLDDSKIYFWHPPEDPLNPKNPLLNVCLRLFSVISSCFLEDVLVAIERGLKRGKRTHSTAAASTPSPEILAEMLRQTGLFEIHNDRVSRVNGKSWQTINDTDRKVLRAAMAMGKLVNFTELVDNVVRQGLSRDAAQVAVTAYSPFLIPVARGQYRILCDYFDPAVQVVLKDPNSGQSERFELAASKHELSRTICVINARTLNVGKCDVSAAKVGDNDWMVVDDKGKFLGNGTTERGQFIGLTEHLEFLGATIGDEVMFEFQADDAQVAITVKKGTTGH